VDGCDAKINVFIRQSRFSRLCRQGRKSFLFRNFYRNTSVGGLYRIPIGESCNRGQGDYMSVKGKESSHPTVSEEKRKITCRETALIVKDFVLLKSFDVVSSGQYRKFVLRKKDLCEQWAMTMHDNYHCIMLEIRNLSKYSVIARSQGHMEIATVCAKLLTCVECPHAETSGWNTCSITKVQCVGGVRVNSVSENIAIVVHPRFLRFCLSFWYASRFEHVLRRVVRGKYTKTYCDMYTLSEISSMIHSDTEIITVAVNNFVNALAHVHGTMNMLLAIPKRGSETLSNFAI
jgi:hypothetical protein